MLKVISTIVFVAFGVVGGLAVTDLGYGAYGIPLIVAMTGLLLWEVWRADARRLAYRQKVLSQLEDFRADKTETPRNIIDATDMIESLKHNQTALIDLCLSLKEEVAVLKTQAGTK
jgi:hypothetical protein